MFTLSHYIALVVLSGSIVAAARTSGTQDPNRQKIVPTPVSGESWLTHLSRPFNDTSMGKSGSLGPATTDEHDDRSVMSGVTPPAGEIAVSGVDLYRLNCSGCHGLQGLGAPPEINSVINPVRGTSPPLVIERMKSRGLDITASSANELAREAKIALLKRLHEGGVNMPPFSYLTEPEIASIISYLNQLAGVPGAATPNLVRESPERIGELLVKSTCHICHGATGPNPSEQQLYQGEIPPLEALPLRVPQANFIRKVTRGMPILMGDPPALYRGRMPVFSYITPQEAADAYLYLNYYPPVSGDRSTPTTSGTHQSTLPTAGGAGSEPIAAAPGSLPQSHSDESLSTSTLLAVAGLLGVVMMLIAGGFALTIREFSRMSGEHDQPYSPNLISSEQQPEEAPLVRT